MKILFVTIATGKYWNYFEILYPQLLAQENKSQGFSIEILVFKDKKQEVAPEILADERIHLESTEYLDWPYATLMRYHEILRKCTTLDCEIVIWIDCDMQLVGPLPFMDMRDGVVFSRHPGFTFYLIGFLKLRINEKIRYIKERVSEVLKGQKFRGTWEENTSSTAFLERALRKRYVHGAFWGGEKKSVMQMCESLSLSIDTDLAQNYIAIWHDESHLNRYCSTNKGKYFKKHFSSVDNFWTTNPKKAKVLSLNKIELDDRIKNGKV
jgi:hypothetical protein